MSTFTIPTTSKYVEADGIRFADRKFGKEKLDPEVIEALAKDRPIILFDNTGVGESSGERDLL